MLTRVWIITFAALLPLTALAADAASALQRFIATVSAASGQFEQERLDESGALLGSAQQGTFSFQRPGRFRWQVSLPYEQLTLSDGRRLYQYDPDLAQVLVRGVDQSLGTSPAAILFGSGSLDDAFKVSGLPDAQGLKWLRAQPRTGDAGFAHVDIGFDGDLPARLLLLDAFGQTTRIRFSDLTPNPDLPVDAFVFTPPPGVDVVDMQGQ